MPENEMLLRLVRLCDELIGRKRGHVAAKILRYIESLDTDNYALRMQLFYYSGKLFKSRGDVERALLAYEEFVYMGGGGSVSGEAGASVELTKLKVDALIAVSTCYLQLGDLHKVIFYYHKLLDIEASQETNETKRRERDPSSEAASSSSAAHHVVKFIELELRVAIRQNLFTAHHRLGELKQCCFYLNEILAIVDGQLARVHRLAEEGKLKSAGGGSSVGGGSETPPHFDLFQVKMDATNELVKLYVMFEAFVALNTLLNGALAFVETFAERRTFDYGTSERQLTAMRYFKAKCYAQLAICMAGVRNFRYARLCVRKSLHLVDKELAVSTSESTGTEGSVHFNKINFICIRSK